MSLRFTVPKPAAWDVHPPERMPELRCKSVRFLSSGDEAAFLGFARSIKAVLKITGRGDEIILSVVSRPSENSLRDLIALFYRYSIAMRQLGQFCNVKNRRWFRDSRAFWFERVFRNDNG